MTSRPWWSEVFRQQRLAIKQSESEIALRANDLLPEKQKINATTVAAIELGEVVPTISVFEAIASALWMDVRLALPSEATPAEWEETGYGSMFAPSAQPPRMSVGKTEVTKWRERQAQ